ncbi:MAG: hypothetical protein LBQ55_10560 [Treponema sp.]|jgi:hypothetical protein|nr:hypothetical protein [Treponema sp.]
MLLFKKKRTGKTLSASKENPRLPRYTCVARLTINGFEGEAVLRNIGAGGFCMESRTYAAITVGDRYVMTIQPEKAAGLKAFELEVEVRWVQSAETKFNSGFLISKPPAGGALEKYIEYIKSRN